MAASCSSRSRMSCSSPIAWPCFDEDLAARVGVVDVGDAAARLLAEPGRGLGLVRQRRRARRACSAIKLEEDLADPRRGEGRAELLGDRPVGLDDPLGDDPVARHEPGRGARLAQLCGPTGPGSIPRWAASVPGPSTPSRSSGANAAAILPCRLSRRSGVSVAALRSR